MFFTVIKFWLIVPIYFKLFTVSKLTIYFFLFLASSCLGKYIEEKWKLLFRICVKLITSILTRCRNYLRAGYLFYFVLFYLYSKLG